MAGVHTGALPICVEWAGRERCPVEHGRNLQGLAEIAERRGRRAEALARLEAASALFEAHGAKLWLDVAQAPLTTLRAAAAVWRPKSKEALDLKGLAVMMKIMVTMAR